MAKKTRSARRDKPQSRSERRFEPRASTKPIIPYVLGALGALAMGAGFWGQFGATLEGQDLDPFKGAVWLLGVGAIAVGAAIWLGTSGEPPLRVGDGGIGLEKGQVRRIPWHAVERVEWRGEAVRVTGRDEEGASLLLVVKSMTHPQAAAWIVREARARVPAVVDVPADATLPEASATAGTNSSLEPPQVVGKRCAASGKAISFEPDARVCPRCERVYHKAHVPESCACGGSLGDLRSEAKTA
ncbi:MAG TPA: hypothetical protein VEK07_03240 [Polyangiaceae bacterium]|nr:hypothetical protein [Polyangiaceae bacterium]